MTEIPDGYIGFVYEIENLVTGRGYIGKKLFRFTRTRKVKGKKQKKVVSSDWLSYFGSNAELKEHVELFGEGKFRRTILHLCRTKGECNYLEAKEILLRDAIISEEYYNQWIFVKVSKNHLPKG